MDENLVKERVLPISQAGRYNCMRIASLGLENKGRGSPPSRSPIQHYLEQRLAIYKNGMVTLMILSQKDVLLVERPGSKN